MNNNHKYNLIGASDTDSDIDIFNAKSIHRSAPQRHTFNLRKAVIIVVAAILVLTAVIIGITHFQQRTTFKVSGRLTTSETSCGMVTGTAEFVDVNNQYGYVFKGIPYASPPVRNLRWKAPVPLSKNNSNCWKGTFIADKFGAECLQFRNDVVAGNEDCLFLNVYTPSLLKSENLPVFVWLHGGYSMTGNGNIPGYSPSSEFVTSMNIVAVSMNFRLNAFGFLTLKELWEENDSYGNYGLMDQVLVLKWIKDNIVNFGGDPNSVTLVGQSSGGTSIIGLLASPIADGLFHKAISMSGSPRFNINYKNASQDNIIFLNNTGCFSDNKTIVRECLFNLSAKKVGKSIPWNVYPNWAMDDLLKFPTLNLTDGGLTIVDSTVIRVSPKDVSFLNYTYPQKIPVLVGSTAQETNLMPAVSFKGYGKSDELRKYLKSHLDPFSTNFTTLVLDVLYENVTNGNGVVTSNETTNWWFHTITSDVRVTCPNNLLAKDISRSSHFDVYRYVVTEAPSEPITLNLLGDKFTASNSFHMWDTMALFNFEMLAVGSSQYQPSQSDLNFKKTIRKVVRDFMEKGGSENLTKNRTSIFDKDGKLQLLAGSYHQRQCFFWNDPKNGFKPYAWVN